MHTRSSLTILLAFASILLFASCNKSNKIGRYIPKTASMVVHTNGESFATKLSWNDLKGSQLFQQIYNDTAMNTTMRTALENPENTGIDITKDLIFFVQKDTAGGYAVLQGTVKDMEKYKSFFSGAIKGNAVNGKEGESSLSNDKMITTWNKDRFILVFDSPQMKEMQGMEMPGNFDTINIQPRMLYTRDLKATADGIFNMTEKNSLAGEEKFTDLLKEKGDIHFWINAGELGGQAGMGPMSMMNMGRLYEGAIIAGTADFLDGKIEMDVKNYAGKEMTNLFKKYKGAKINMDMVKHITSKDLAVFLSINFQPEALREFIKLAGMEGFANMFATSLGFTLDDFVHANKGDVLLTVHDIKNDTLGKPAYNFLFSAAVNDKTAFNKLIEAAKKAGKNKVSDSLSPGIFYNITDKYFAIGNQQPSVNTYLNSESNHSFPFMDKISGSPVGLYINFQYLMRSMAPNISDSIGTATYNASLQMWDNLTAKGGEFVAGGITQHVEINLVDKKTNSLKQLNNYLGVMSTLNKKKRDTGGFERMRRDTSLRYIDTTIASY
jgi:hypothetical protein